MQKGSCKWGITWDNLLVHGFIDWSYGLVDQAVDQYVDAYVRADAIKIISFRIASAIQNV